MEDKWIEATTENVLKALGANDSDTFLVKMVFGDGKVRYGVDTAIKHKQGIFWKAENNKASFWLDVSKNDPFRMAMQSKIEKFKAFTKDDSDVDVLEYKIGDLVSHSSDSCPFRVVGLRAGSIEIEGDFSGGTHNVCQTSWVYLNEVKPYSKSN